MSDFPSLAAVLRKHADITEDEGSNPFLPGHPACACGWEQNDASGVGPFWSNHAAEVWREACTITTTDQLDALPTGAFVRDAYGQIMERRRGEAWWRYSEKQLPLELPALLIWHPGWTS